MTADPLPPPPWACRLTAVVRLGVRRRRLTALAVVAYADTPVGAYGEALLAELRLPLRITVPWIVVDSAASAAAGRAHWGLPKTQAPLDLALDLRRRDQRAAAGPPHCLDLRARAHGPVLPVAAAAVLHQPGRGPAALRFRGRVRPAVVRVTGGPWSGAGPGAVLRGALHLAAPRETAVPGSAA